MGIVAEEGFRSLRGEEPPSTPVGTRERFLAPARPGNSGGGQALGNSGWRKGSFSLGHREEDDGAAQDGTPRAAERDLEGAGLLRQLRSCPRPESGRVSDDRWRSNMNRHRANNNHYVAFGPLTSATAPNRSRRIVICGQICGQDPNDAMRARQERADDESEGEKGGESGSNK